MSWQPDDAGLRSLMEVLKLATSPDSNIQRQITERMESFNNIPDYNNYLAYICAHMEQVDVSVRAIAGLKLKNNIRNHYSLLPAPVLQYVVEAAFKAVSDNVDTIRSTAGIILATVVSQDVAKFPQVLPRLLQLIESGDERIAQGAFNSIQMICEDAAQELSKITPQILQVLVPKCIMFFQHPNVRLRVCAVLSANQFVPHNCHAFDAVAAQYVNGLYQLTSDTSPEMQKAVCQAFVMILEHKSDLFLDQLDNVIGFMVYCTQSEDEVVSLEASEFWLSFSEQEQLIDRLSPHMAKVVPVLLAKMVYSEEELANLEADDDDAAVPDSEQSIKPRHHKAKEHQQENTLEEKQEDEDESEWEDDEDFYGEWTPRKAAAAALDVLATTYGPDLLTILLPHLKDRLFHNSWVVRESAILALGAIADGCLDGMTQHMADLLPILLNASADAQPLVRSIACWTLSRYVSWIAENPAFAQPLTEKLLSAMLSKNKKVQEAAASAFAVFAEETGHLLAPFLDDILRTITMAFHSYQRRNLMILFDAIGTIADSLGHAMSNDKCAQVLLPPLMEKWRTIDDDALEMFPLLECIASVAVALGPHFGPSAEEVWNRAMRLLIAHKDDEDTDTVIVSLDLLSGVVQALGEMSSQLISRDLQPFFEAVVFSCCHQVEEVRQAAFALLGDMAIHVFEMMRPHLNVLIPVILEEIKPVGDTLRIAACNNAIWAVGEVVMRCGLECEQFTPALLTRVVAVLHDVNSTRTLAENAAITIGRMGLVTPNTVAPALATLIEGWCRAIAVVRDNMEKETAYLGMCNVILTNPSAVFKSIGYVLDAFAAWQNPSQMLNEQMRKVVVGYKEHLGEQWSGLKMTLPLAVQQRLQERYQV